MGHLSHHDLWSAGANLVVALPPSPGDVFVVTTIEGRRVLIDTVDGYSRVLRIADAFVRRFRSDRPVTVKVLCLSLWEARAMGYVPASLFHDQTPCEGETVRRAVVNTCTDALRHSDDARVRAEALQLLNDLGAMP